MGEPAGLKQTGKGSARRAPSFRGLSMRPIARRSAPEEALRDVTTMARPAIFKYAPSLPVPSGLRRHGEKNTRESNAREGANPLSR